MIFMLSMTPTIANQCTKPEQARIKISQPFLAVEIPFEPIKFIETQDYKNRGLPGFIKKEILMSATLRRRE